jgi:lipopolysaccharide transport system ATP-binding protein
MRERLRDKTETEGLTEVMNDDGLDKAARIQRSWLGAGEVVLRYEDLIANDVSLLVELFVEKLGLPVMAKEIERVVVSQRFDTLYGRKLGEEDVMSHGRKGVAGDWKNHFTRQMAELFHARYGDLLKDTGYESDASWVTTQRDV